MSSERAWQLFAAARGSHYDSHVAQTVVESERPVSRPLMRMHWRHLAFIHWRVPVERLRGLIPPGLEVDTFDGSAWVGLVPFTMRDVLPHCVPRIPGVARIPAISAFHECNVRTYVHPKGRPDQAGVWFFSLDAASRAAVWTARRLFHLPYHYSRIEMHVEGDRIHYRVDRVGQTGASLRCAWRVGDALPQSQPGELGHFLTARLALYSVDGRERVRCGRIWHEPWRLRECELISLADGLVQSAGIALPDSQQAIVYAADPLDVVAWPLEPV